MEEKRLKILVENELFQLVLANSEDELTKIDIISVRKAIDEFIGRYKEELTEKNIDFLAEYIWTIINKKQNKTKEGKQI